VEGDRRYLYSEEHLLAKKKKKEEEEEEKEEEVTRAKDRRILWELWQNSMDFGAFTRAEVLKNFNNF